METVMTESEKTVTVGSEDTALIIGNDQPLKVFAGPCAMESREHAL